MGKIGAFVGLDYEIGQFVGIGPVVGIGLFGGTGPVVSLTYMLKKCTDQLCGNSTADKRLFFSYIGCKIPLLS